MKNLIKLLQEENVKKQLKQYQIGHLWMFGSYAKGNETKDSDIDLLYKRDKSLKRVGRGIISAKTYLEKYLGKKIDLISIDHIHNLIEKEVLSSKKPIW